MNGRAVKPLSTNFVIFQCCQPYFILNKQVIKLLGKGGFGAVFQVQSSIDNKMYAAKLESYEHSRSFNGLSCLTWS
ncbi:unnamed protein product [Wuchereria bancrofti]|uniref:Protein kinase domain-containing protein n=1 Tax=Wuchereria bancrofti TaxID=6293 RepID=A0A3P7F2I3_WUCBA|nr:unnamed protein product [Wuchereria bancrofti]